VASLLPGRSRTNEIDVFISYAKEDQPAVRELAYFLEAQGYSVWWDSSLRGGDDYQIEIMQKIVQARVAFVLWSYDAVQSKGVRAEAGAALNENKLVPVKIGALPYEQIPPPFNLLHAIDLRDKVQIKAALTGKLAIASPPAWKKLRYELLSWIGVIGGSITFAAHLQGFMQVSWIADYLVRNWIALLFVIWRNILFFVPKLTEVDALALSIIVFTANTLFLSPIVEAKKAGTRSLRAEVATALSFCILLLVFSLGIYASIDQHGMLYNLTSGVVALAGG
jgi:hypothetical protein